MRIKIYIFKSALVFSALFLLCTTSFAQKDVLELLPGSERLEFDEGTGISRLIGNVNFLYQGNKMYCDSAHFNKRKNTVRAYGHVHINKRDTLNMFCDSLFYEGDKRKATLWGNVRVRDNEYKLTTDTLHYDVRKGQASYFNGGKVESIVSREVLTSKVGYFHPEAKNFFFSKQVKYVGEQLSMNTDTLQYLYSQKKTFFYGPTDIFAKDATMYCENGWYNTESGEGTLSKNAWLTRENDYISGDTLYYHPEEKYAIGKGNVFYHDSTQEMSFNGDYAFSSDSLNYSFITGHAIATKKLSDDTMYVHADTLYMLKQDSADVMKAFNSAALYSTKVQCKADSIVYSAKNECIELYTNPIVWSKNAELKGDFIDMHINDTIIHLVNIYENSSVLMEVEPDNYYNQIAGRNITAYFKDNDLYRSDVTGNAITIFYPEDEQKSDSTLTKKRMGMNRLYASNLRVDIDSNEVTGISYMEQPDGVFYPMDQIKKDEQFIKGFLWQKALRPTSREDLIKEED